MSVNSSASLNRNQASFQDGQAAVVQSLMKLNLFDGQEILSFERGDDEFARLRRQIGDIANGTGARAFSGAEGLTDQIRNIGLSVLAGRSGSLNEHGLHISDNSQISKGQLC